VYTLKVQQVLPPSHYFQSHCCGQTLTFFEDFNQSSGQWQILDPCFAEEDVRTREIDNETSWCRRSLCSLLAGNILQEGIAVDCELFA
jgi:hypothetical protein